MEAVLATNQGLADEPQPLRAGLLIILPDIPSPADDAIVLWN